MNQSDPDETLPIVRFCHESFCLAEMNRECLGRVGKEGEGREGG